MNERKAIYLDDAIDAVNKVCLELRGISGRCEDALKALPSAEPKTCAYWDSESNLCALHRPSAQPERLTDDDFETIRIHLNAYKEKLCNQQRWKEAEEYQRIIDRFMAFASLQPEIIRCEDCMHNGSFDTDCPIEWGGKEYCSFAERIEDVEEA